jgi:hypothetical protein
MVPDFLHGTPPTGACAAFIKESRMKFVNARELDRKSGCTLLARGTRPEPKTLVEEITQEHLIDFKLPSCEERGMLGPHPHHENGSSADQAW